MTDLLFDAPWWLPTLLGGAGIVLFWNGNRRGEARVRNAGLGLALAAALVITVSYLVDTVVEKAEKQSRALVRAVEQRDWPALTGILDPRTELKIMNGFTFYENRDEIVNGAMDAVERYGVKNLRILTSTAERADTLISVTMTLYSEHEATMGRPITTTWLMEWQEMGDTWSLARITFIKMGNLSADAAARHFPRPR